MKLESALEFVEDDLPGVEKEAMMEDLSIVITNVSELAATFDVGRLLRDGLRVAVVGRPNVGKSSLFNRLACFDRAIVTEIPGTTRDSLNESSSRQGIRSLLTDTAGVRESSDQIERMGVERSRQAIADADLALVVVDGSQELEPDDFEVLSETSELRHLIVRNKSDLSSFQRHENGFHSETVTVDVSALSNLGLEELRAAIISSFGLSESAMRDCW